MEQSLDVTRTRLHSNLRPIAGNFTRLPRKLKKAITTNYCSELLPLIKSGVVYIATSGRVDSSYKRIRLWGPTLWIRKPLADSLGLTREKSRIRYISLKFGVDQKSKAQKTALKTVKLKHNTFYSFKELKDLVKCAYDKLSVKCTAKATDIQSIYSVKSTSRNGVRGYLIVGKI